MVLLLVCLCVIGVLLASHPAAPRTCQQYLRGGGGGGGREGGGGGGGGANGSSTRSAIVVGVPQGVSTSQAVNGKREEVLVAHEAL